MRNPFKYFNSSPEIIRLAVLMYVKYPLSLRNVEDLLAERGIDICHETVRHWWNRFGPMFAAEIKKKRIGPPRSFSNWRWHLDEVFVKINGELHYLWRAVDHEGEVLEVIATKRRDRKAALILLKRLMKKYGKPHSIVTDPPLLLWRSDESYWQFGPARMRALDQQSSRKLASAVPTKRACDAPISEHEDVAEILLRSRLGPEPLQ